MLRREFLKRAGLAALAMPAFGDLGCSTSRQPGPVTVRPFELDELTVSELQAGLEAGRFSATSLTRLYLARIAAIDQSGPEIRSVIEVNRDAESIARELDQERKSGHTRGPLHGIPVLLKDNIDTGDRMMTTAGSLALEDHFASEDSVVAQKLRAAGAVLLGKTNLSEWANFRSEHSTSGWSGRGGQTNNPYALNRNPSGSSSGSGAAVAANLCAFAIGTETDGSIVSPATACGIVGLKPTVGLISRSGIIPIGHSQDTAGPMTRTVADAALVLGLLTGVDSRDPATRDSAGMISNDYTQFLDEDGLKGARIGIAREFFGFLPDVELVMGDAIQAMEIAGAVMIDPAEVPAHDDLGEAEYTVLTYEFKNDLNLYLGRVATHLPVHNIAELIEFNERYRDREMPFFAQETLIHAQERGPLTDDAYRTALEKARRLSRDEGIDAVMNKHRLDALIAPTGGPAFLTDHINGDNYLGGSSSPAAIAGYPSITVPAGFVHGLPVGISFFGRAWSEPTLLRIAYAFEQATKFRRKPKFLPAIKV